MLILGMMWIAVGVTVDSSVDPTIDFVADSTAGSTVDSTIDSSVDSAVSRCPSEPMPSAPSTGVGALGELCRVARGCGRAKHTVLSTVL